MKVAETILSIVFNGVFFPLLEFTADYTIGIVKLFSHMSWNQNGGCQCRQQDCLLVQRKNEAAI